MTQTASTLAVVTSWRESLAGPEPVPGGPGWRALLEARWRSRLQEVTELSVAFHDAAASVNGDSARDPGKGEDDPALRRLLRQAVAARQALAETDEALRRLAAGTYGRCEGCAEPIGSQTLRSNPEARYCPHCG